MIMFYLITVHFIADPHLCTSLVIMSTLQKLHRKHTVCVCVCVCIYIYIYIYIYRVARSRLTHFKFQYCASAIACRGWREGER